jgi:hypothetical protein
MIGRPNGRRSVAGPRGLRGRSDLSLARRLGKIGVSQKELVAKLHRALHRHANRVVGGPRAL